MWLAPVRAASEIGITPDQWLHWVGSGHVLQVFYQGRTPFVPDDEVESLAQLWALGGKGYLPLYRGYRQTFDESRRVVLRATEALYPSALVAKLLGKSRKMVGKLCQEGQLEGEQVGYRLYVTGESLRGFIEFNSGQVNPDPIISDIIVQKIVRGHHAV